MAATIKSDTLQVVEATQVANTSVTNQAAMIPAHVEANVAAQVLYAQNSSPTVRAPTKMLVLAPPQVSRIKSDILQVLEATDTQPTVSSVTNQVALTQESAQANVAAQVLYADQPGTKVTAPTKMLVLRSTTTTDASALKLEVIGQSTIIPPVPGQQTVWFFN